MRFLSISTVHVYVHVCLQYMAGHFKERKLKGGGGGGGGGGNYVFSTL